MWLMVASAFPQLEYHLEHADEAIKHLQSAVTTLRITHGNDHLVVGVLAISCIERSQLLRFSCGFRSVHQVSTAYGLLKEVEGEIRRAGRMSSAV